MEAITHNISHLKAPSVSLDIDQQATQSQLVTPGQQHQQSIQRQTRIPKHRATSILLLKSVTQASHQLMACQMISSLHLQARTTSRRHLNPPLQPRARRTAWIFSTRRIYGALLSLARTATNLQGETHLVDFRAAQLERTLAGLTICGIRNQVSLEMFRGFTQCDTTDADHVM